MEIGVSFELSLAGVSLICYSLGATLKAVWS